MLVWSRAWLVWTEHLSDVSNRTLEKHFVPVFSSFLGLGPADGSSCRNQKLLPSTVNTRVRLSIQWWYLQKSNKKRQRKRPGSFCKRRHLVSKVVGRKKRESPLGSKNKNHNFCKVKCALNESLCLRLCYSLADCLLASEEEFSVLQFLMI